MGAIARRAARRRAAADRPRFRGAHGRARRARDGVLGRPAPGEPRGSSGCSPTTSTPCSTATCTSITSAGPPTRRPARLTFGRARHVMSRAEWEYWTANPDGGGPNEPTSRALDDRVDLLDGEATIAPGITLVPTPGHTPGHCSFLVASGTSAPWCSATRSTARSRSAIPSGRSSPTSTRTPRGGRARAPPPRARRARHGRGRPALSRRGVRARARGNRAPPGRVRCRADRRASWSRRTRRPARSCSRP